MTQQTQQALPADPFAGGGEKTPALSFVDAPIGTTYHFTVTTAPEWLQTKNFETDELEFWPDGNKKLAAVFSAAVDELGGEVRSVWARKPSALFRALQEASQGAGVTWGPGVRGSITLTGEKPNEKNPRLNPQKLYSATCQAADPFAPEAPAPAPFNLGQWAAQQNAQQAVQQPAQAPAPQVVQQPAPVAPPATPAPQPAAMAAFDNLTDEQKRQLLAMAGLQQQAQPAAPPF